MKLQQSRQHDSGKSIYKLTVEQKWKLRNRCTFLWSIDFQEKHQSNAGKKRLFNNTAGTSGYLCEEKTPKNLQFLPHKPKQKS